MIMFQAVRALIVSTLTMIFRLPLLQILLSIKMLLSKLTRQIIDHRQYHHYQSCKANSKSFLASFRKKKRKGSLKTFRPVKVCGRLGNNTKTWLSIVNQYRWSFLSRYTGSLGSGQTVDRGGGCPSFSFSFSFLC